MGEAILRTKLTGDSAELERSLREAVAAGREFADRMKDNIREVALEVTGLVLGFESVKEAVEKVYEGVRGVFDLSRDLRNLSNQTGASIKDLVQLRAEFDLSGIAADNVGGILNRMQRSIEQASDKGGPLADMFYRIGLNLYDLQQLNPAQQFELLRQKLTAIEDPARRAQIAMKIFGNFGGGGSVLSIFGNAQIVREASEALSEQSDILSKNANTFQEVSIQIETMRMRWEGFFVGIADPVSKVLMPILQEINSIDLAKWGEKIGTGLADGIRILYNALRTDGGIGDVLDTSFQALITSFGSGFKDALIGAAEAFGSELLKVMSQPIAAIQAALSYNANKGELQQQANKAFEAADKSATARDQALERATAHDKQIGRVDKNGNIVPQILEDDTGKALWELAQRADTAWGNQRKVGMDLQAEVNETFQDYLNRNIADLAPTLFDKSSGELEDASGKHLTKAGKEIGDAVKDAINKLNAKYGSPIPGEGTPGGTTTSGGGRPSPSDDFSGFGRGQNISGFYGDKGGFHGAYAWSAGPVNIESGMAGRAGRIVAGPQSVEENTSQMNQTLHNIEKIVAGVTAPN